MTKHEFRNSITNASGTGCAQCTGKSSVERSSQIRSGVEQLLFSDVLPSLMEAEEAELLMERGVIFGDLLKTDNYFREAKLPNGWAKVPDTHTEGCVEVFDEKGRIVGFIMFHNTCCDRVAGWVIDDEYELQCRLGII